MHREVPSEGLRAQPYPFTALVPSEGVDRTKGRLHEHLVVLPARPAPIIDAAPNVRAFR